MLTWGWLIIFGIAGCQQSGIPDYAVPFKGMIYASGDSLLWVNCQTYDNQIIAPGHRSQRMLKLWQDAPKDRFNMVYMHWMGAMQDVAINGQIQRMMAVYRVDSILPYKSCIQTNSYNAGGKYDTPNGDATLILGFNAYAQWISGAANARREPGYWSPIDSTHLRIILNQSDTLVGRLQWNGDIQLTGHRFGEKGRYMVLDK